jgi:outer membrane protein assembly factor BamB
MKKFTLLLLTLLLAVPFATADDWPQWQGPDRTNVSNETGLLQTWPSGGPRLLWTFRDAGAGYSGPAIVGDRLYTMGADSKTEYLYALDLKTQKKVWSTELDRRYKNDRGDGPRGTPTVDGDHIFAISGEGMLVCIEAATGKKVWSKSFPQDFRGKFMGRWGFTESPLVDGDVLVCSPGGAEGTLAALNKKTGELLWRSKGLKVPASYSSIIAAEVNGVRQYIQMTSAGVVGVAAKDGSLLWEKNVAANGTAVIPTPIFHDNHVFVTSGYGAGCGLVKLTLAGNGGTKAEEVFANKNMVNHHGGVVLVGDYLYGHSDSRGWICQKFKTGEVVWAERSKLGKGSLTYADGHLICYSERGGNVVLVKATPDGWKEDGRFKIPEETKISRGGIWTHPVVANGRLYLRDQDLIFCYDLKAAAAQ